MIMCLLEKHIVAELPEQSFVEKNTSPDLPESKPGDIYLLSKCYFAVTVNVFSAVFPVLSLTTIFTL